MSHTYEKVSGNKAKLTFTVPAEQFDEAMQKAYLKMRGRINVPGFRKGKAPRSLIERMYGEGVFYEDAFDMIFPEIYQEAVKAEDIHPVDQPNIDIDEIGAGKELKFHLEVFVRPDVELGEYKGLSVEAEQQKVSDAMIDARIAQDQDNASRTIDVEDRPVQEGDTVNLDYAGTVDGVAFAGGTAEKQTLKIGSHQFIEGFEEQMIGMNIGEEKDLNVTFPEAYHAKDLAGKAAVFHVKLNGISEKVLPELNDEFASEVSEFETLEAYKADVKAKLLEKKQADVKTAKENALTEKAVENAEMDIPAVMIESQAEDMVRDFGQRLQMQGMKLEQYMQYTGMTMPQMVDQYKDQAKKRIQGRLVLEAIAKAEGLEATEEDLENEYKKMAEQYSMEVEKVKEYMGSQEDGVKEDLATQKALDLLVAEAK